MTPISKSLTATSIDATQRKLIVGIVIVTLMTWTLVSVDLASDAVHLRDRRPAPGRFDRANPAFEEHWRAEGTVSVSTA